MRLLEAVQHFPVPAQTGLNWGAVSASVASFVGIIQGPLAVIASLLSIAWLSLQIYSWFDRRSKK
jgi:hypothetical protein